MATPTFSERAYYWANQIGRTQESLNAWLAQNESWTSWENSVELVRINSQKFIDRAKLAVANPIQFSSVSKFDAHVKALLDGVYLQIKEPAPNWTTFITDTVTDVKNVTTETIKNATTWGAGGLGIGIVVAALYLLPWKR